MPASRAEDVANFVCMIKAIQEYCKVRLTEFDQIPTERKQLLEKISAYIATKLHEHAPVHLVYICTHNSRRSHFGQVWAKIAAQYYGMPDIQTYSGGTEATAFNANAINALKRVGFIVNAQSKDANPLYHVSYANDAEPILCFSKVYDHADNPQNNFTAIMTCSDAEENCPFIPGVELRIATTYNDPKAFDGTPQQDAMYDERCKQIARECLYVFSKVRSQV